MSERKNRGKCSIFLGYAAGVGKTYAMLEEAHELKRAGVDVAAAYIEPHARTETIAMAEGLEEIPPLQIGYKGLCLREMDLDAVLKRKPKLALVDELAHTNAEGCRHAKRYEDIEELLAAGIDVYTTVNIQHLESLNDVISAITGIRVKERVPDRFFDRADEVKIIDIEPKILLERLRAGKIYKAVQAERALENFFAREKLISLREIALRRTADRVNQIAIEEKRLNADKNYYVGEHILTCISPSPSCMKVIRSASRMAAAFHGKFTAIYVETPYLQNADRKVKKMAEDNLHLAKALGAKIVTVFGEEIAPQIAEYARVCGASKLVLGRTNHRILLGHKKGTLTDQVSELLPDVDIYIIPDVSAGNKKICLYSKAAGLAGIIPSTLTRRRTQARESAKQVYRMELLLENSKRMQRVHTLKELLGELSGQARKLMKLSVLFLVKEQGQITGPWLYPRDGMTTQELRGVYDEQEKAVVQWVLENGKRAGCCTHTLPGAKAMYLPVKDGEAIYAVMGIVLEERREIPPFEYALLSAMLNEAALVFERIY